MRPRPVEQRQEGRLEISVPCLVTWENQRLDGRTVNLSQGGACIDRTLIIPPQGARIQLTIRCNGVHQLSGRVSYNVRADEARQSFARFGVEFDRRAYGRFRMLMAVSPG